MSIKVFWPVQARPIIYPVFIPFLGCVGKCIFCAQQYQTGRSIGGRSELKKILSNALADLRKRAELNNPRCELAFYGGTFTALASSYWDDCMELIRISNKENLISSYRCSTRPDAVSKDRLRIMRQTGASLIELGVQSFADNALKFSGRAYEQDQILEAVKLIKDSDIKAGIQLMPGMPGQKPGDFLKDVKLGIQAGANIFRFYPCLVIEDTSLAKMWQTGRFKPWNLNKTINILAHAWNMANDAKINVIRMGLPPQAGFEKHILAGPYHPALGNRVMSYAFFQKVRKIIRKKSDGHKFYLNAPKNIQGLIWGWRGELKSAWNSIGLKKIIWQPTNDKLSENVIEISFISNPYNKAGA